MIMGKVKNLGGNSMNELQKAIEEKDELDENYQLPLYALFLLAELQDKESFPKIMEFVS